jgi:5-(carboxyamino)imidazole ribonucleotide synthase
MPGQQLKRGATIGIMGAGQLGRMLTMAAARLGFRVHIYSPRGDNPAFSMTDAHTPASYDDEDALRAFAAACDVVTYEWENIPVEACDLVAETCPVYPGADVLRVSQDRVAEKSFISGLGIPVPDFHPVGSESELEDALQHIGCPSILKTRRFGYDGKGQARLQSADDAANAWAKVDGQPSILEAFVPFEREVSIIAARAIDGTISTYDPAENIHENGILRSSTVPARLKPSTANAARTIATTLLEAMDYVGILGVEMFVVVNGGSETLMVNEIAPRVHNSGHWTEAACLVSQFEQHIRAITGWPLGNTDRQWNCVMQNLLGEEIDDISSICAEPDAIVHDYGKVETRPGRKMGHVTRLKLRQRSRV